VRAILRLRLLLATIGFAALLVFVSRIDLAPLERRVVLVAGASLFTFAVTLDWVFYGLARSPLVAAASITRVAVFVGFTLLLVHDKPQVWLLPLVQAAGELAAAVQLGRAYRRAAAEIDPPRQQSPAPVASFARKAWPLGLGQLMRALNF